MQQTTEAENNVREMTSRSGARRPTQYVDFPRNRRCQVLLTVTTTTGNSNIFAAPGSADLSGEKKGGRLFFSFSSSPCEPRIHKNRARSVTCGRAKEGAATETAQNTNVKEAYLSPEKEYKSPA